MALKYLHKKRLFRLINKYNLFDKDWYLFAYPDVANTKLDPYQHYYKNGIYENRNPNPLFSSQFYLDTYHDVRDAGVHPFYHYIFFGGAEGRMPHPLLAPRWISQKLGPALPQGNALIGLLQSAENIGPRPLFDIDHMRSAQNQPPETPARAVMAAYFLTLPQQRVSPNRLFHNDFVRQQAQLPDTADAVTAYIHGHSAGLRPHPLFDAGYIEKWNRLLPAPIAGLTQLDLVMIDPNPDTVEISALFDNDFYKSQNGSQSDRVEMPLLHYLREGWKNGLDPNRWFDTNLYISRYLTHEPDVNPLMHYGLHERNSHITLLPRFQDRFYTMRHPEVAESYPGTPLEHYLNCGLTEGRALNSPAWLDDFACWDDVKTDIARILADTDTTGGAPQVSVIIPVYDQFQFTLRCIWSILRAGDAARLQIIVADDGSQDETQSFFSAIPQITYIRNPENLGFLKSCNQAALSATADHLFFLNNDTAVLPGWIDSLLDTARALPDAGLIGSKLVYPDGTLQEAGGYIWADGSGANLGRHSDPAHPGFNMRRDADYVSGAAILVPTAVWTALGGFDVRFAPAYYEDTDLAFRLRNLGWRVIYQPGSVVVHFEGVSSGTSLDSGIKAFQTVNQTKFLAKWAFALEAHAENRAIDPLCVPRPPRPRILIIDAVVPEPDKDAGSVVAKWYMRLLIDLGYDVVFAAHNLQLNGQAGRDLQALGVEVLHVPYVRSVSAYLETHITTFDMVMLYRYAAGGTYIEQIRTLCPQMPIVFNTVDLHHLREERQARQNGSDPQALAAVQQTKDRELRVIDLATETILLSPVELEVLRQRGPSANLSVIPLVLETQDSPPPRAGRDGIVFVGGYGHPPNVDAVLYFIGSIWPLVRAKMPDLMLHIVGSHPPPEILNITAPGVKVHGFVADLDQLLAARIASIAPLRYGAGIKGKVASSLAAGLPCVASGIAAEGMGLVAGRDLLVANAPQDFAAAIIKLCTDPVLWASLSDNGRAIMRADYSPGATRQRLLRLLAKTGTAPFSGLCPLSGHPETRRFQNASDPGSLCAGPGAPDVSERIIASALIRLRGADKTVRSLAAMQPGALPPVAVISDLPNLTTALTRLQALVAPARATLAVGSLTLGPDAASALTRTLASLPPLCRHLMLSVTPEGPLGTARIPAALAALVWQLEAAGWEVRLDPMPIKDSALTGVVLIEARRSPA